MNEKSAPVEPPASVDLDALLSPAGPYETGPDAGNAAGAQLVTGCHGRIWWAPQYGCDSLDHLLHQIGARILPHLRPPVIGVDVPGPDGDWGDIADLCQAEGVDVEAGARLLRRVRAAWHPAWYQAQPTPPAEGEVGELVAALKGDAACIEAGQHDLCSSTADQLTRAAELLQQQADELATLRRQAGPPAEEEAWSVAESVRRRSAQNPMGSADPTLIHAAELLERLAGELATLRQLAEEILALVSESTGVAGLHLNGDIAPWDELLPGGRFERLTSLPLEDRPHG